MPRLVPSLASAAIVVLFLAPYASAQGADDETTEVTFYGHIFGSGRGAPMPMNTQFPAGEADLSQGLSNHGCDPYTPGDVAMGVGGFGTCEDDADNENWWYTTAGFVQVKESTEFSYDKLHNERGLTKDTYLDMGRDITAEYYMSADAHGWLLALCGEGLGVPHDVPWPIPCWNWDPGYLPQWQVEATLYTAVLGEYGGAADEAPDVSGAVGNATLDILAQGVSDPVDVQSLEAAGSPIVWKFDINLGKPLRDVIKKEESYLVRFKWWSVKPNGDKMIIANVDKWNVDGGEYFPPTLKLPVKGAFNVELVIPQFVHEKLVVLGIMNTPWGSYDVNQESIKLEITDSNGKEFAPVRIERLADFSVAHGGHYKPVNVTYVWDYKADKLPPGTYTAKISGTNFQASASASCEGKFTVGIDGEPGDIVVGECGRRTISEDQLTNVQSGSANDAAAKGSGPAPKALLPAGPVPQVKLASAGVTPVGLAWQPLGLAAVALALLARRWAQ